MSIQAFAKKLIGKECTTIIGGAGSGSVIGLGFGERLRRTKPLKNPMLREADRNYASELELTVYCAWRLGSGSEVLCGWRDAGEDRTWSLLRSLVGRTVESTTVEPGTHDVAVRFDGAFALDIFCDITANDESEDNYTFADKETIESVGIRSVVVEPALRRRTVHVVSD